MHLRDRACIAVVAHGRTERRLSAKRTGIHTDCCRRLTLARVMGSVACIAPDESRTEEPTSSASATNSRAQVDIEWHTVAHETLATQIDWLARTSIFVANIGSPSFRMVYLPDGAQVRRRHTAVCSVSTLRAVGPEQRDPYNRPALCFTMSPALGLHHPALR